MEAVDRSTCKACGAYIDPVDGFCPKCRHGGEVEEKEEEVSTPWGKSQADTMVELALGLDIRLFTDQYDTPHIRFPQGSNPHEVYKTWSLRSGIVKTWLADLLWKAYKKAPGGEAISSALNVLKAQAHGNSQIYLYNRVAPDEVDGIYIDMADTQWRAIHVDENGWRIRDLPPVLFRRFKHQLPLPNPVPGGDVREILEFANLKDPKHRLLYVVDTVSKFIPGIPHPISYFHGPHGGGKSMAAIAQRFMVDPSIVKLLKTPKIDKELVQQMFHHYLPYYDNLSSMPEWMSDTFCRAVTGTGNSKRRLYTDDDDIIYQYRRCPGVNGINIVATRGDFLDRAILYECGDIDESRRLEDKELDRRLFEKQPRIFGAILDTLVKAMQIYPTLKLKGLFRMADFTRWGYAIAEALGYGGEAFLEAYRENVANQRYETIKQSVVAVVLLAFMEKKGGEEWQGEPAELYMELQAQADEMKVSRRQKAWPKNASWMVRRLNVLSPSLPAVGYHYENNRTGESRRIRIYKVGGKTPTDDDNGVMPSQMTLKETSSETPCDANDTKNTTLGSFSRYDIRPLCSEPPLCAECNEPITDGSYILWNGRDRICSRCAIFRKKVREVG